MLFKYGLLFAAMCLGAALAKSQECKCKKLDKAKVAPEEIGSIQLPDCDCPREVERVCGSDGNTYANACFLKCAQSASPSLDLSKDGPCDERDGMHRAKGQSCDCPRAAKSQIAPGLEDCLKKGTKCATANQQLPPISTLPIINLKGA